MSAIDELLQRNRAYVETFNAAAAPGRPAREVAVVACMDARLHVPRVLGLDIGDAHLIANAGGVVTEDVLRSLVVSQRLLGTREVMLLHHSECGMQSFDGDELRATLEQETGVLPAFAFYTFSDLDADVRDSVRRVRQCAFLPHRDAVRGFVYDVRTGALREVSAT